MTTAPQTVKAMTFGKIYFDGAWREGSAGEYPDINPATEEVLGGAADGTRADMERAVAAARHAFDNSEWSRDGEARAQAEASLERALAERR